MKVSHIKNWIEKNDKYLSILFFTGGFILDNLTLTRIDMLFDNLVLISYLFLASFSILLLNILQNGGLGSLRYRFPEVENFLSLITQFTFGGLFSGYVIFYTKSASWASSWIFLLIIYALFVGNEKFRKYYKKIDFQIIILFIAIFSFLIFFLPVVLKTMNAWIFVLSGAVSLVLVFGFAYFLFKFVLKGSGGIKRKNNAIKHILSVYVIFNLLYFLNIIPPVPLSTKDIGVYKNIQKEENGVYILTEFEEPWYQFGNFFLKVPEGKVYVYSSVFAPTDLNTKIINVWQKYNEAKGKWEVVNRVDYPLYGGRSEGYRGYSFLSNVTKGKWRVDVETERGQVVGRVRFGVEEEW